MISGDKIILTKNDIFRKVALKKGWSIDKINIVYDAFLKASMDKIKEENIISFPIHNIGDLYMNVRETERLLKVRGYHTKKVDEITNEFYKSLKIRVQKARDEAIRLIELEPFRKIPFLHYKAYYFYGAIKNGKVANFNEYVIEQEEFQEKIFYEEDKRFN